MEVFAMVLQSSVLEREVKRGQQCASFLISLGAGGNIDIHTT
jgi:hypothetical protein